MFSHQSYTKQQWKFPRTSLLFFNKHPTNIQQAPKQYPNKFRENLSFSYDVKLAQKLRRSCAEGLL